MKSLYVAYCTEYEVGWGSRPDGLVLTEEKSVIDTIIEAESNTGSRECYWRYSTPEEVFCDKKTWKEISKKFKDGRMYSSSNSLKNIGTFFKEV
jgi:hypothetical protein